MGRAHRPARRQPAWRWPKPATSPAMTTVRPPVERLGRRDGRHRHRSPAKQRRYRHLQCRRRRRRRRLPLRPTLLAGVRRGLQQTAGSGPPASTAAARPTPSRRASMPSFVQGSHLRRRPGGIRLQRQQAVACHQHPPGLQPRTAYGQTGANQFYGQLETGYRVDIGGAASAFVTPFALVQGSTVTQNGFTETGAQSLNLTAAQQTTQSLRTVFGVQLGAAMDVGWREKIAAQFRLGWNGRVRRHEPARLGVFFRRSSGSVHRVRRRPAARRLRIGLFGQHRRRKFDLSLSSLRGRHRGPG